MNPNYTLTRTNKDGENAVKIVMEGLPIGSFALADLDAERTVCEDPDKVFVLKKATDFLIEERKL